LEPTDAQLIEAVLAGDRTRFTELVERHGRVLLAFLARRSRDFEEAREVYQETWVRAFEGLGSLRERNGCRAWLLGIGARILGKRRGRIVPLEALELAADVADQRPSPREELERGDLAARVREELARLPPRQRAVFELRALRELEYADVARLLGITIDNARANYYQAALKLRAALGEP
jgi:RNA polymerase sigma-70 factor (ECF subfamily)